MNRDPHSLLIELLCVLATSAIAFAAHRLLQMVRSNRLLTIDHKMRGSQEGFYFNGRRSSVGPFRDFYQVRFFQRSVAVALLLGWKWICIVAAVLMTMALCTDAAVIGLMSSRS